MEINIILEVNNAEETITLRHTPQSNNNYSSWDNSTNQSLLRVFLNNDGSIGKIDKDKSITSKDDIIISQFLEQYQNIIEIESSGISADDDDANSASNLIQPYDPELIRVDTKPFSLKQVYELMEDGDIDLSPDFQRHFVWKETQKKSRLIESIMLRIPLPVFYLAQDNIGKFQVVDGLQRLTVIKQFINNEFKLNDLEYLKECDGSYYNDGKKTLDHKYIRRITQTQLVINIIDPQTPNRVKFEIFKRLNQGGKPLKPQEIRNCMANSVTRKFINDLTNSNDFLLATDNSVNPIRMEDQELVLRFIGFYFSELAPDKNHKYTGNMESFLDDTLDLLNSLKKDDLVTLKEKFIYGMKNSYYLFGRFSFRKCSHDHYAPGAKKQLINKSLFTAWSVLLSMFSPIYISQHFRKQSLNIPLANQLRDNHEYYDALSFGTNDVNRIQTSFQTANYIISQEILNHDSKTDDQ